MMIVARVCFCDTFKTESKSSQISSNINQPTIVPFILHIYFVSQWERSWRQPIFIGKRCLLHLWIVWYPHTYGITYYCLCCIASRIYMLSHIENDRDGNSYSSEDNACRACELCLFSNAFKHQGCDREAFHQQQKEENNQQCWKKMGDVKLG